jgi:hypothetical protein
MPHVKTTHSNSSAEVEPKVQLPAEGDDAAKEVLFFDRLKAISEAEWESQRTLRIYRRLPAINRPGRHYIEKLNCAIDEDYLLRKHGSGVYLVMLNDTKKTIDSATVQLYNPAYPPNVSLEELTDDPGNAPYLALLRRDPDGLKGDEGTAQTAVAALSGLLNKLVEQREAGRPAEESERKLTGVLVDWALKQTSKERETATAQSDPGRLTELVKAIKELAPAAPADPLVLLERLLTVTEKLRPQVTPETGGTVGLKQLDQLLDVIGKLEETFGRRATSGVPTTAEVILKNLPEVLREAGGLVGKATEAAFLVRNRVAVGPGVSPGAQIPIAPASPAPQEQATATPIMPARAPLETEPLGASAPSAPTSADAVIKQAIVAHMQAGRDGYDVGSWLEMTDPRIIEALEKLTLAQLKEFLLGDPILSTLKDFPGLEKFLADFYAFLQESEEAAVDSAAN